MKMKAEFILDIDTDRITEEVLKRMDLKSLNELISDEVEIFIDEMQELVFEDLVVKSGIVKVEQRSIKKIDTN